jgi:hypothetical protein
MIKKITHGILPLTLILAGLACKLNKQVPLQPQPTGKIIYQSDQYGNTELLSIDVRSVRTLRLTNNSANDNYPSYIRQQSRSDSCQIDTMVGICMYWISRVRILKQLPT